MDCIVDVFYGDFLYMADYITEVERVPYRLSCFLSGGAVKHRCVFTLVIRSGRQDAIQRCQMVFVAQVDTNRVGAGAAHTGHAAVGYSRASC